MGTGAGYNKSLLVFAVLVFALVLLISSEVAAKDLEQHENVETMDLGESKQAYPAGRKGYKYRSPPKYYPPKRRGCYYGCCDRGYKKKGYCSHCCHNADEAQKMTQGN